MADNTQTQKTTPFNYRYPLQKLDSADDYLKVTVIKYVPPEFSGTFNPQSPDVSLPTAGDPRDIKDELGYIILPIPDSIKTANTVDWGASSLNPIQAAVFGAGDKAISQDPLNTMKDLITALQASYGLAKTGLVAKYGQSVATALGANLLLGPLGAGNISPAEIFSRYSGAIINPNIELIFTSVKLRDPFSFSFDIVPRSKKEADMVKEIIKKFKYHSAAKKTLSTSEAAKGFFLAAPDVFKIEYMSGKNPHPYLNKFKICAMNGIGVDYTGGGTYATYSDGTPVSMRIELSFQELTPVFAEDQEGQEGTGY